MNCKPGDLAVIVRSDFPASIGCLCLVLKSNEIDHEGMWCWAVRASNKIEWEYGFKTVVLNRHGFVPDAWLRPIRDNDGEDEMLRIVGKPEGVTA